MYLKPIVKMPVIGNRISLKPEQRNEKKLFLLKQQLDQYRSGSNLYCHSGFQVTLKHEAVRPKEIKEEPEEHKPKIIRPKSRSKGMSFVSRL